MMAATLVTTALATAVSVVQSIQQSQAQAAQQEYQSKMAENNAKLSKYQSDVAKYQADVQRKNAELAEDQASAERAAGFEAQQAERLKTAQLIGRQRAQAGASGVAVDLGSFADVAEDTAARGDIDAINQYNRGIDQGYNTELQAWGYKTQAQGTDAQAAGYLNQAGAYEAQASMLSSQASQTRGAGALSALGAGLGGIADMGSTWAKFNDTPTGGTKTQYWDRALNQYVPSPVRH